MRRCPHCQHSHITGLPHEDTLRYWKAWADIIIALTILGFIAYSLHKKGFGPTATAKVP